MCSQKKMACLESYIFLVNPTKINCHCFYNCLTFHAHIVKCLLLNAKNKYMYYFLKAKAYFADFSSLFIFLSGTVTGPPVSIVIRYLSYWPIYIFIFVGVGICKRMGMKELRFVCRTVQVTWYSGKWEIKDGWFFGKKSTLANYQQLHIYTLVWIK